MNGCILKNQLLQERAEMIKWDLIREDNHTEERNIRKELLSKIKGI